MGMPQFKGVSWGFEEKKVLQNLLNVACSLFSYSGSFQ